MKLFIFWINLDAMGLLHKARPLTSTHLEGPDVILELLTAESVEGREWGPSDMVGVSVQVLESLRKLTGCYSTRSCMAW